MKLLSAFILLFPRKTALSLGRFLGRVSYYFFRKRRKLALTNLALSLGEIYSFAERKEIIRTLFENLGANFVEFLRFPEVNEKNILDYVVIHNRDILDKYIAQNKGILGLSAHMGNWEFLISALGLLGYQGGTISKKLRQGFMRDYMLKHRAQKRIALLSGKYIMKDILKILKSGGIVGVVLDQHGTASESVEVPFFGRKAWTFKSLALLAKRTNSPVLPMYAYRDKQDRHHIVICPEIVLCEQDTIESATLKYTQWIETVIRKHPEQWIWTHNRWKENQKR